MSDNVNHPKHYTAHPSGIEAIQVTEHMNFCLGNAVKYCFRSGSKVQSDDTEDLRKAVWYATRDLENISRGQEVSSFNAWQCKNNKNRVDEEACANKEWLHDFGFFISSNIEICSYDGPRNFFWETNDWYDGFSYYKQQKRQQHPQFDVGVSSLEHQEKEDSWHRTCGRESMVVKIDGKPSHICEIQRTFREQDSKNSWCISRSGKPYPFRKELGAYIEHEKEEWRKKAVFYLCTEEHLKAVWYINREIERRKR